MTKPEKTYDRIEWIIMCNGSMDPSKYLGRKICRAFTNAAYEKPITVQEIIEATGIPSMYVEDELDPGRDQRREKVDSRDPV